jgi:hypothetical protein
MTDIVKLLSELRGDTNSNIDNVTDTQTNINDVDIDNVTDTQTNINDVDTDTDLTINLTNNNNINELINLYNEYKSESNKIKHNKKEYKDVLFKNRELKSLANNVISTTNTNSRKVVYEEMANDDLLITKYILLVIYFIFIIIFIYYGIYLNAEWKKIKSWIILIVIIIFPFITYYISILIKIIYYKITWLISNKIYKNTYV